MPLGHSGGDLLDRGPVRDVAGLGFGAELGRRALETLATAGQQDAAPALRGQASRNRGADPARASRDDRDANAATLAEDLSRVRRLGSSLDRGAAATTAGTGSH